MNNLISSLLLILFFTVFSLSSCKSENREYTNQNNNGNFNLNLSENVSYQQDEITENYLREIPQVFLVRSVSPAKPGNIVDFVWLENGKERKFSEVAKGKIVLLNFWGTWCPPCRREIPDLVEIHNESNGKDYLIVGIVLERDVVNAEKNVADFAKKNGIRYLNIIDKNQDIARAYGGINAVPTTFIIDKKGKIVETIVGMRSKSAFLEAIERSRK